MDRANLIIAFALLIVTGGAAVAAVVQARIAVSAREDAETARNEARELNRASTAAFLRQALAQERRNQLMEDQDTTDWRMAWTSPEVFELTNHGLDVVFDVRVKVQMHYERADASTDELAPGNPLVIAVPFQRLHWSEIQEWYNVRGGIRVSGLYNEPFHAEIYWRTEAGVPHSLDINSAVVRSVDEPWTTTEDPIGWETRDS